MLEEENNRIPFHWEKSFIFMQIALICLLLQHGCHEHTIKLLQQSELYFYRSPASKSQVVQFQVASDL